MAFFRLAGRDLALLNKRKKKVLLFLNIKRTEQYCLNPPSSCLLSELTDGTSFLVDVSRSKPLKRSYPNLTF